MSDYRDKVWKCADSIDYPSGIVFLAYSDPDGYLHWKPAESVVTPPDILLEDKCHEVLGIDGITHRPVLGNIKHAVPMHFGICERCGDVAGLHRSDRLGVSCVACYNQSMKQARADS